MSQINPIQINPNYKITFGEAVARFWKGYFKFSGRATRSEFWWAVLFHVLGSVVVWIVSAVVLASGTTQSYSYYGGSVSDEARVLSSAIPIIWAVVTFFPGLSLYVRRLHDSGESGYLLFQLLIPIFNLFTIWCIFFRDSDKGRNQYGDSEKYLYVPMTKEVISEKAPESAGTSIPSIRDTTKFCPHCGNKIQRESAFCPHCGGKQPSA